MQREKSLTRRRRWWSTLTLCMNGQIGFFFTDDPPNGQVGSIRQCIIPSIYITNPTFNRPCNELVKEVNAHAGTGRSRERRKRVDLLYSVNSPSPLSNLHDCSDINFNSLKHIGILSDIRRLCQKCDTDGLLSYNFKVWSLPTPLYHIYLMRKKSAISYTHYMEQVANNESKAPFRVCGKL